MKRLPIAVVVVALAMSSRAEPAPQKTKQIYIDAGIYLRGLNDIDHRIPIKLRAFFLDQTEVTNAQYAACVKAGKCSPSNVPPPDRAASDDTNEEDVPVRGITWNDADAYCKFVGRRLPTEAEWEKAAFPGTNPSVRPWYGPLISPKYDRCEVLVIGGIHRKKCPKGVLRKEPEAITPKNKFAEGFYWPDQSGWSDGSVYDLFGNVAEWVADWDGHTNHKHYDYDAPDRTDPQGPKDEGFFKIIRGGSYLSTEGIDQDDRRRAKPDKRFPDVGFRCASDASQSPPQHTTPPPAVPSSHSK